MATRIFLILIFSAVFLMVGILSLLSLSLSSYHNIREATAQQVNTNSKLSLSSLIQQGSPLLGKSSSAPITIVEFADFQCHFCDRFAKQTEPQINQTYIQTGKVNMVFKHFPIRGLDSKPAAMAAQCTNEQGKFWDFYKLLYDNQGEIDSGWASKDNLKRFALQLLPGLNIQKFNSCFDNQKYKSLVDSDIAFATSLGVRDVPYFIVVKHDGSSPETLIGAQPFSSFKAVIDKKISEEG
jgi:protein-disulfide isomerase